MSEERVLSDLVWTPERGSELPEVRGISWENFLLSDDKYLGKWKTDSGIRVTPETALQSTVVLACCRILAETVSGLPIHVYRRNQDGSDEIAKEIPLYKILTFRPNEWQTKAEFFEQIMMNLTLWGNSYTRIRSGLYGSVSFLDNLHPSRMDVERLENGRLRYSYTDPETGRLERYTQDQVMHIRWTPEQDGIKGMVPVEIAREAIGLARACEQHAARFWANSARPGVVLQTDGTLTAEAAERLRDNWERLHRGSERAYKTAILTGGLKAQELGMTNEASQFQSSRAFQTEEIGRVYRIPGHLIQGTPGGDLEVQGQEFVTYTLMPWLTRIESSISRSLIYNDDEFYAKFDVRGLLRANSNARASYYSTMINLGVYTINDVRRSEGLKTLGPIGDHHFVPMNTQTLEDATKPKPEAPPAGGMPGGGGDGPPPPAPGGPPSLPEVKTGKAPIASPKGEASKPKQEMEDAVEESSADWEDAVEGRAFCATGPGGGVKNDCGSKDGGGSLTASEAAEKFDRYRPFTSVGDSKNSDFIRVPSDEEVSSALKENDVQQSKIGASRQIPDNTPVALRIDIPAWTKSEGKTYVVTVHEGKNPDNKKSFGPVIGYDSVARLSGPVRFSANDEDRAQQVAEGKSKTPLATVNGKFSKSREIPSDIDSWTPVGYDPQKAVYFYDKRTGREVIGGTDAISVGNTVFTRQPEYGPRNAKTHYRSADEMFACDSWGLESRSLSASNQELYSAQEKIAEENGKWPQADAHYMGNNPFASRGMKCSNCLYFEKGQCEIVQGSVSPDGICKLWIIPEEKLSSPEQRAFCPTGSGGGVDNSCGGKSSSGDETDDKSSNGESHSEADFGAVTKEILRSIDATGGYSVHPITAESPTTGYMVATVQNAEEKIDGLEAVTEDRIRQYFDKHVEYLSKNPDLHLGGWFNLEDGKVYLDLSQRFENIDDAIDAAVDKKQLAIWDLNTKSEIRQEHYDARRTRPKESRAVRLPARCGSEGNSRGDSESRLQALGGESREGPDCGRGPGGIFGPGNKCQVDGDGEQPSDAFGNPLDAVMRSPSSGIGGGGRDKADTSWKKSDAPSVYQGDRLRSDPPARSLAGVSTVAILNGKTLSASLKETGVTLDQAAKVCGNLSPESNVVVAHGDLKEITEWMGNPSLASEPKARVTVVSKQPFGGVEDAIGTAATLERTEDDELLLSYSMFSVAPEAQRDNPIAVARGLYSGVVKSIVEAEKIGVEEVGMYAAGSDSSDEFKGYRIWPRLGFDGIIPRNRITPTYSLRLGFFERYGSSLPDDILSDKARQEKSDGALTIQSLYETKEGQRWWEENGGPMAMSLRVGDDQDAGWQRFKRISDRASGRDILGVLDIEWRSIREEIEGRAFCATGEGNGIDNSCGSGTATGSVDNSWKKSAREYTFTPGEGKSPIAGGEIIKSLSIEKPKAVADAMKNLKVKSLTDVVAIGGGITRGAFTSIAAPAHGEEIHVMSEVPIDPDNEDAGSMSSTISLGVDPDGKKYVDYSTMHASTDAGTANLTGEEAARMSSILLEKFPESLAAAEKSGFDYAKTFAMGSSDDEFKGYRLWPQFGFDAEIYPDIRENIPKDVIPHDDPVTVQELISTPAGKKWWNENGESMAMTLNLKDKKSAGYKRYKEAIKLAERLKKRNEGRSLYDYLMSEDRAFCPNGEGNGVTNSCSSSGGDSSPDNDTVVTSGKPASVRIDSQENLDKAISSLGASGVDDIISLGGGNLRGSDVGIAAMHEADGSSYIQVSTIAPVERDGSTSEKFFTDVSIRVGPDGKEMGFESLGMSHHGQMTKSNEQKVMSLVAEKVVESVDKAEQLDFDRITTWAVGDRQNGYKGYRLWPQFGFDGVIPREVAKKIPADLVLSSKGIPVPPVGSTSIPHDFVMKSLASQHRSGLTIQELIKTTAGKRWWDQNGSDINLTLDLKDKSSLGYKRWEGMKALLPQLKKRNETRKFFDSLIEDRAFCPNGEGNGVTNDCSSQNGSTANQSNGEALSKATNVDVMIGGAKTTAVIDEEARTRALEDTASHPRPEGLSPGSTADLWSRTFVERNGSTKTKITATDPVFPQDRLAMNGTYVAHESVGQYLSMRHEEDRASAGGVGPGAIIDTTQVLPSKQFSYVSDALSDDVMHAYESGRFDPGFYSKDLEDAMTKMASRHPELTADKNARFVFTMLTAILSNGQDPTANIADSDGLYEMYKQHGTCMPAGQIAGTRSAAAKTSLALFQSMLDSFGVERTKNLLSGYTTADNVNKTFAKLSAKSANAEWRERTDSQPWMLDHYKARDKKTGEALATTNLVKTDSSGEFKDEVVPMASIFGPKIGSFFANLNGRHDFLTMDRWLMRSVGRVTGELITRSTPQGAKSRAEDALKALDVAKWKPSVYMFGIDKQFGLTKQDLLRSLKIQKKTGVIEENGAAYLWATAAERSHKNTTKPGGGGYGRDPDPDKHACHVAGNGLFKSLIHEQQDPRGAQARRSIREVFRSIVRDIETKYPDRKGTVDVDEVQAILWQYEKNLWKHLGAKVQIDENSLYSKAADDLLTGKTKERKFKPESRSALRDFVRGPIDSYDEWPFQQEQESWDSDIGESGIDFNELFLELERLSSADEHRSALKSAKDAVVELRSAGLTTVVMPNAGRDGLHVMGFDADIPQDLAETLPETLSHCKTLLDLHVSSEGRSWWEQNGRDIDVAIDLDGVQGRIFDGFASGKTFSDIIEEGILDDYGNS